MTSVRQGWAWPVHAEKPHFFVGGVSLCRKWNCKSPLLEDYDHDNPENCPDCHTLREKRERDQYQQMVNRRNRNP